MANLETKYLGLRLKNPIVVGASELTNSVDKIIELEKAGAGAVVLKSLFEEQILLDMDSEISNDKFNTYHYLETHLGYYLKTDSVNKYMNLIREAKNAVDIPIIASINCFDDNEWIDIARHVQDAGADALEVNLFVLPADINITGEDIEKGYLNIVTQLLTTLDIPISLKISSYFSGFANFANELSMLGAQGLVLFNKFYNPKVDIESEAIVSAGIITDSNENANTLRWLGILSGKVECDLSASTGIHNSEDIIANILVGASTTQLVSSVMKHGNKHISVCLKEIEEWMAKKNYKSIDDFKGKLNQKNIDNPMLFERAQFMKYYTS